MDKIKINSKENICSVCGKDFKHSYGYKTTDYKMMYEVRIITTCVKCDKLLKKKEKLESELLDIDFEIFSLTNSIVDSRKF